MEKKPRPGRVLALLAALVVVLLLAHVNVGSSEWYTPWAILGEIVRGPQAEGSPRNYIVWMTRLPRASHCLLVGAILGMVGSAFQAQFRNPLADPYIVGVSSGAATGGVVALILGLGGLGTLAFGFVGGMLALALALMLARRRGVIDVTGLLLAGVVLGAFLSALLSLALLWSGRDSNTLLGWLLGNMGLAFWDKVAILAAVLAVGSIILFRQTRRLNALALGEETAARLGVDPVRLRNVVLTTGTAMTAAAVGAVGIVGFLGLVAPHISRRVVGVDWRWSLAGSGLIGAGLLLAADLVAQRGLSLITHQVGFEVPVGIVTAVIGAPVLLALLRRQT